ncbi:MAG TPA: hypothetical protein VF587_20455 [Solirubrobacteraceae bacterium]|jgi:hypothetical protein
MNTRRRLTLAATAALALAASSAPAHAAAPPNDSFAGAYLMEGTYDFQDYTTKSATFQAGEPATDGVKHTVWFKWKPTQNGNARLKGFGREKDVYAGTTLGGLTPVKLWADSNWNPYWEAKAGVQYYVRIDGWNDYGTTTDAGGTLYLQQDTTMPQTRSSPSRSSPGGRRTSSTSPPTSPGRPARRTTCRG